MASTRFVPTVGVLVLMLGACSSGPDEDPFASLATSLNLTTSSMGDETTGDGDGDPSTGDGDGDPTTSGDGDPTTSGDGDPTTSGDGDPTTSGDGDPTTSGDGDPTTSGDGDPTTSGDGDPTTSGDGDPTTSGDGDPSSNCGWYNDPTIPGYYCGGVGTDPGGMHPYACPGGLIEGAPCGQITGVGCCDANGDNWYCAVGSTLVKEDC